MRSRKFDSLRAATVVSLFLSVPLAYPQCADTTTTLYAYTTAVRLNGNAARLMGATYLTGDFYNWWYAQVSIGWYFNGTHQSSTGWQMSNTLGAELDAWYTPTLQTYGPGTYLLRAWHDAYTPYCGTTFSQYCDTYGCTTMPPWGTANSITIQRPSRPDYAPNGVGHPVYFLGRGIAYDGQYSAMTSLVAGNPNGAPETPHWVFLAGDTFAELSCTDCHEPVFTATKRGSACLSYDVVLATSYNGFMSDYFWQWTNSPRTNRQTSVYSTNYDPADPNRTPTNGYFTKIEYQTTGLCSYDAPLSNYDINEQFGTTVPSYSGENWPVKYAAGQGGGSSVAGNSWFDLIGIANNTPPGTPAYCNGVLCIPQFSNPGVGPHTLVDNAPQTWFVGSIIPGNGVAVQTDTFQRYTDSGWHHKIATPVD